MRKKHKLTVVSVPDPGPAVEFTCERCVWTVFIERPVLEAILTKRDNRLTYVSNNSDFGRCRA